MKHKIREDEKLVLIADEADREKLLDDKKVDRADEFFRDKYLVEFMEDLIANSELDWIGPEEVGALTSAPMLGVRGTDGLITHAWAWMDYQVKALQEELLEEGRAVLEGGLCRGKAVLIEMIGKERYDRYLHEARGTTLYGISLQDFDREELMVATALIHELDREELKNKEREARFLRELDGLKERGSE